jgi:hypothetical protein
MSIHVCKQCGSRFEYCRACVFRPIRYKDKGFCSKECYEASKIEIPEKVEMEPIKEEILTIETEEVFVEDEISEIEEEIETDEVEIEFYEEEIEDEGIRE